MPDRNMLARPALLVVPLVLVTVGLYWPTIASLFRIWTDPDNPTYSHGSLLLAVCVGLFSRLWIQQRDRISLQPNLFGSALLAVTSLVWFLARLGNIQAIQLLSLPFLIDFSLWSLLGYRTARSLSLPFFLLIFAIPIWDGVRIYLQETTAIVVVFLLGFTGIPSVVENGIFILVPAGTFEVAPGCGGLSQFLVAIIVAILYSHMSRMDQHARTLYIGVAIIIAFISNTLRIYVVVLAGQLTAMQHFLVTHHWTFGWVVFSIIILMFLLVSKKIFPLSAGDSLPPESGVFSGSTTKPRPLRWVPNNPGPPSATATLRTVALVLGALAVGPVLAHIYVGQAAPISDLKLAIPAQIGSWQATGAGADHYRPYFRGADVEYDTLYRAADGANVYLYVAYYARQEQGKEAVYYLNTTYDGKQWKSRGERDISVDRSGTLRVKETRIQSEDGRTKIVWQWYYVNGSRTSNDYMAKILNVMGTLRRHPGIAVVVVAADANENIETARSLLMRFVADAIGKVERGIDAIEST
jgi:EpsI family protein